jgi:5-methyltetrahydrofolate--homocysteine methyltransferase
VHDIGKNLVDIILTNNGYKVVNLGIKVPVETMLAAATEHRADAIGMSGLLVKSTLIMKENLEIMRSRGIRIPVVLGGAALTRRFVEQDLRAAYGAEVSYAGDAFDGLAFMERVMTAPAATPAAEAPADARAEQAPTWSAADEEVFAARAASAGAAMDTSIDLRRLQERAADAEPRFERGTHERPVYAVRSAVASDAPVPRAPFLGSSVVTDIHLEQVYAFINETALFRGQWQLRRGRRSEEEYKRQVEEEIRPIFDRVKLEAKRERVLAPAVVYGYFPCASDGDEVIVYRPREVEEADLHGRWPKAAYAREELVEWQRFVFPRQRGDRYLCLADYFRATTGDELDVCAFSVVTMGAAISAYTKSLFESDRYQEYLYMHGLGVECAEALAEYWHKMIRTELGIAGGDAPELKALFSQGYQGSRYSFGYPACPRLEDQVQLFALLAPERIGVTLTEEYQLVPEQSTSAIVVHHPEAKYFAIR